jgi:molecular chaperone HscB
MPAAFLMQQMAWRETLDEVRANPVALDQLLDEVELAKKNVLTEVEVAIDVAKDFEMASEKLRALLFIDKFSQELEDAITA